MKNGFIEKTLRGFLSAADYAAAAERTAAAPGLLQQMDPRMKLILVLIPVAGAVTVRNLGWIGYLFGFAVVLAIASRLPLGRMARWVWIPVALFTGAIALPAVFLVPHGARSAAFLIVRAETATTFSALLVLTTPWPRVLRALRVLCCPVIVVSILDMTYRYIFLILHTAFDMMESRKSRTVGRMVPAEARRVAVASAGVLMSRSFQLSEEVHSAMLSRGFRGEIRMLRDR